LAIQELPFTFLLQVVISGRNLYSSPHKKAFSAHRMKVTLAILALNELDGLKAIMPKIDPAWVDQIIMLDGNSTDGSIEWYQEQGYEYYVQKKKGIRHAWDEVYDKIKGEVLITFSPDGNSVPELLPPLIEKMKEGYDMVIVSRYKDEAVSEDDDIITAFGNWCFTNLVNVLFGSKYTDVMVMYRAYKTKLIFDLDLDKDYTYEFPERLFHTKISWEPLLSARAARLKLKIGEIPGDEPARIGGERKLQIIRWGSAYLYQIIRERFVRHKFGLEP